MKKIGIFIGVEYFRLPAEELKREGLIRLSSIIINQLNLRTDTEAIAICSKLAKPVLQSAFGDINKQDIQFLTPSDSPPLFSFMQWRDKRNKKQTNKHNRLLYFLTTLPSNCIKLVKRNVKKIIFNSVTSLYKAMLCFMFLVLFIYITTQIIWATFKPEFLDVVISFASLIALFLALILTRKISQKFFVKSAALIRYLKANLNHQMLSLYDEVRNHEVNRLVELINKSDLDFVFVPTAFYSQVSLIKKPMVVTIPDLLICDYPQYYVSKGGNLDKVIDRMRELIANTNYFTCYSDYVAKRYILPFAKSSAKIRTISHGNTSIAQELMNQHSPNNITKRALAIAHKYLKKSHNTYYSGFNLKDVKYLIYTSQNRPHKNITNLLKAYNILLREKFCNVKLILTGVFEHTESVNQYIINNNLQYDVWSLPNLSNRELAAFDHLAHLAVNPTLFEGGFPFTFNEAYSVGTPSIMSKIPVVLETITDEKLQSQMLFDPYDVDDMVEKIYWGIMNREKLLELQLPLYQQLSERNWEVAAQDYIDYFNEIMEISNKK